MPDILGSDYKYGETRQYRIPNSTAGKAGKFKKYADLIPMGDLWATYIPDGIPSAPFLSVYRTLSLHVWN